MDKKMKLVYANKQTLPVIKSYLLGKVPILNPSGFRRTGLPLHKALVVELKDAGLNNSSNLLEKLLMIDSELQRGNKLLKDSKTELLFLKEGLQAIETVNSLDFDDEIRAYLNIARHFEEKKNISFFWVAKEFYEIVLKLSENEFISENRGSKAFANFYFGRFLNIKLKKYERSEKHLSLAKDLAKECSTGYNDWYINDKPLSECIDSVLLDTLMKLAEESLKSDTDKAFQVIKKAVVLVSVGKLYECTLSFYF